MTPTPTEVEEAARASRASDFANEVWRDLLEKDDRTSPAEYPEMCLIDHDELASIIFTAVALFPSPSPELISKPTVAEK